MPALNLIGCIAKQLNNAQNTTQTANVELNLFCFRDSLNEISQQQQLPLCTSIMASSTHVYQQQPQPQQQHHLPPLSPFWAATAGGLAGICEVSIQQPTLAFKNALQQNRPIPRNPIEWYRGVFINAASIAPITAIQFGVNNVLSTAALRSKPHLTDADRLGFALTAGTLSGFVSGPAELILTQQQLTGLGVVQQAKKLVTDHGYKVFSRGMTGAMARDGTFTCGYIGLAHISKDFVSKHLPTGNDIADAVIGSVAAGIAVGLVSHPLDTIKTRIQGNVSPSSPYTSLWQTAKIVANESGVRALWDGVLPRTTRIIGAVFILNEANRRITTLLQTAFYKKNSVE